MEFSAISGSRRHPNRPGGNWMRRLVVLPVATAVATTGLVVATATGAAAWSTEQDADASCEASTVVLRGTFFNNEPQNWGSKGDMKVRMVRILPNGADGEQTETKVVVRQTSGDFQIDTGLPQLGAGQVRFDLWWADGRSGYDKRYASFDATDCRRSVTPRVTKTEPTCQNPNLTLTGVPQIGVTWEPRFVVIAPGQSGTVAASLDEYTVLTQGAQTVFTETNTFNPDDCFVPRKKPRGHINCGCKGDPSGVLDNTRSNVAVSYVAKATRNGHVVFTEVVKVGAGHKRGYSFGGHKKFKPGTKLVLRSNGHVLDRLKVGPRCPQPPHSGLPKVVVPKA